jgi:hypothetical protein
VRIYGAASESTGSIVGMTETPNDNIGAILRLVCRRGHPVGTLWMNRPQKQISYRREGQSGPPESWPLDRDDFYEVPCPGGCPYVVGAPTATLITGVLAVANDPDRDEGTFTLADIHDR